MAKTLGLDLGTNSIGWAIVENEKNEETRLIDKGVLIFSEGVKSEKGIESSKAAARTEKRSARRIKFRRKLRKYETLCVLAKMEMCPLSIEEVLEYKKTGFKTYPDNPDFLNWLKTDDNTNKNPYYFRDKASRGKIGKLELGRALYHIAQRRGFLSSRLDKSDEGIIELHKPELETLIELSTSKMELLQNVDSYFDNLDIKERKSKDLDAGERELKTLYNFFQNQFKIPASSLEDLKTSFIKKLNDKGNLGAVKLGIVDLTEKMQLANCETLGQYFWKLYQNERGLAENKIRNHYTSREEHYLQEFKTICEKQNLDISLIKELERAIFYQRPLKSQKGTVGKCSLEKGKSRCPISHPDFEEFRMLQFINSIKIYNEQGKMQFLSAEQRELIKDRFYRKSKPHFNFSDIAEKLGLKEELFNFKGNTTVSGCSTSAALKQIWGENWKNIKIGTNLINKKGKPISYNYLDFWHVLFTFDSNEKLFEFGVNKLGLDTRNANIFSRINLKKEYASLSLNAINKILPYLRDGLLYSHAVFMANMQNVVKTEIWNQSENRELIKNNIQRIIDDHQKENQIQYVINSLLKTSRDNDYSYSKEADEMYRKDLEQLFIYEFGEKTWSVLPEKDEILKNSFSAFVKCFKATKQDEKFLKIKRIDEKVLSFLDDNDLMANKEKMYHPSDLEKFKPILKDNTIILGSPVTGAIKNPMAMKTMHQLRKLINALIIDGQIDSQTKINIELARELNDANKRKAIQNWQKEKEAEKQDAIQKIKELYQQEKNQIIEPTNDDVLRYQLWEEQGRQCLYTEGGKNSIGISDVVGGNTNTEIEHTIPRSLSYDNTKVNLTLAKKTANNLKGNKTPYEIGNGGNGLASYETILNRIAHWKKNYEQLDSQIKKLIRTTKAATTKEQKDLKIQQRHKLKLEYDYWKDKYDRFLMKEVPSGFSRRQLTDIGTITRYAREYLSSYFNQVYSVKGSMVDEFRKIWGLHEIQINANGIPQYMAKDRSNHIHHCKDAITIACMNKYKYDKLAEAWGIEEQGEKEKARNFIAKTKPWPTFAQDVRNIENEVLVVHLNKDVTPIQSKKKLRKRGKIQKNQHGQTIYQQGDTIRGSLHKDTFYAAIASKDENGDILKDSDGKIIPTYVERVDLKRISKEQANRIVDEAVKEKINEAISTGVLKFGNTNNTIAEEGIWMNKEKQVPINKVRVFASAVKSPLHIKKHRDQSIYEYKQHYHAVNDENYCMAIYEGMDNKGNVKRSSELINMMEAGNYYKRSNKTHKNNYPIVPEKDKNQFKLKYILTKGKMVLIYNTDPQEIWELSETEKLTRLHEITQLDVEGAGIKLLFHQEAREKKEITQAMGLKIGMKGGKNIGKYKEFPWIKIGPNGFDALVEGYDFTITTLGRIIKL